MVVTVGVPEALLEAFLMLLALLALLMLLALLALLTLLALLLFPILLLESTTVLTCGELVVRTDWEWAGACCGWAGFYTLSCRAPWAEVRAVVVTPAVWFICLFCTHLLLRGLGRFREPLSRLVGMLTPP